MNKEQWVGDIRVYRDVDENDGNAVPPKDSRSPFEMMYAKGQLYNDQRMNSILYGAGTKYFQDWYLAGMSPISAMNYNRSGGGESDGSPGFMPVTNSQLVRRESWRRARKAMRDKHVQIVDKIVLEGRSVADVWADTGYNSRQYASSSAIERLCEGLHRLAEFYGMVNE